MSKNFDETVRLQSVKRREWDTRDMKRGTTKDCGERKQRSPSGQLISRVVSPGEKSAREPIVA